MQTTDFILQLQARMYQYFPIVGLVKYDQETYDRVMELFDNLPLACLVNGKFLCVHGGISHELRSVLDDLFLSSMTSRNWIDLKKFPNLDSFAIWFGLILLIIKLELAAVLSSQTMSEDVPISSDMSLRRTF